MANDFNVGDRIRVIREGVVTHIKNDSFSIVTDRQGDYIYLKGEITVKVVERAFVEPQYGDKYLTREGLHLLFLVNKPDQYGPYHFWDEDVQIMRYYNLKNVKTFKKIS